MADKNRLNPVATPPQTPAEERARLDEKTINPEAGAGQDARDQSARPDPRTGEIPAGPGDAGLEDRPEVNTGSAGTKQMSNRRLLIGLGIAAFLAVVTFIIAALF